MAADPMRTTILGNFRREYKTQPSPCRQFPWYSRLFTGGHIAIECDPDLWAQVKALMLTHISTQPRFIERPKISRTHAPVEGAAADLDQLYRLSKENYSWFPPTKFRIDVDIRDPAIALVGLDE